MATIKIKIERGSSTTIKVIGKDGKVIEEKEE